MGFGGKKTHRDSGGKQRPRKSILNFFTASALGVSETSSEMLQEDDKGSGRKKTHRNSGGKKTHGDSGGKQRPRKSILNFFTASTESEDPANDEGESGGKKTHRDSGGKQRPRKSILNFFTASALGISATSSEMIQEDDKGSGRKKTHKPRKSIMEFFTASTEIKGPTSDEDSGRNEAPKKRKSVLQYFTTNQDNNED